MKKDRGGGRSFFVPSFPHNTSYTAADYSSAEKWRQITPMSAYIMILELPRFVGPQGWRVDDHCYKLAVSKKASYTNKPTLHKTKATHSNSLIARCQSHRCI